MGKELYTAKQFIDAIPGTAGIITTIAKRVGCDWHTAKKYTSNYLTVRQAYDDECEAILDVGEAGLFKAVQNGEEWAIKYLLSTKGKRRGYSERKEITGENGSDLRVIVDYAGSDSDTDTE